MAWPHAGRSSILGRFWPIALPLLLIVLAEPLGACSAWRWRQDGDACVRESPDQEQRVTNYTDPELCDRPAKKRPPDRLRVPPGEQD